MEHNKQSTSLKQKIEFKCKACGELENITKSMIPDLQRQHWKKQTDLENDFFHPVELRRNWQLICLMFIGWKSKCCYTDVSLIVGDRLPKQWMDWYYSVVRPPKLNGFLKMMYAVKEYHRNGIECYLTYDHKYKSYSVYKLNEAHDDECEEMIKIFDIPKEQIIKEAEEAAVIIENKKDFFFWLKWFGLGLGVGSLVWMLYDLFKTIY